jgi:hypothetical protein
MDQTRVMPYEELNAMLNDAATFGERKSSGASAVKYPLNKTLIHDVFNDYSEFVENNKGSEASLVLFILIPYKKVVSVP